MIRHTTLVVLFCILSLTLVLDAKFIHLHNKRVNTQTEQSHTLSVHDALKAYILHIPEAYILSKALNWIKKEKEVVMGHYLPERSYIVSATSKGLENMKEKIEGLFIHKMQTHHKHPHLEDVKVLLRKHSSDSYHVVVHIAELGEKKRQKILKRWTRKLKKNYGKDFITLLSPSPQKVIISVAKKSIAFKVQSKFPKKGIVHWVEVQPPTKTKNKWAAPLIQDYDHPTRAPLWKTKLNGHNQLLGVGDTGVDVGHCMFYDPHHKVPFETAKKRDRKHRKFYSYFDYMDRFDSKMGHGTHVAGIASGNPIKAKKLKDFKALAYKSKMAFMDLGCDTDGGCSCPKNIQCECDLKTGGKCPKRFGVVYMPLDLRLGYFPYFYQAGAKIVSNSWGTGYYKDFAYGYSTNTQEIDQFTWEHKDFLPVFAAGNSGGQYAYESLTSESNSKNSLVIGASQNTLDSFKEVSIQHSQHIVDVLRTLLVKKFCASFNPFNSKKCEAAKKFRTVGDCCKKQCGKESAKCCGNQEFGLAVGMKCCPRCAQFDLKQNKHHYSPNNLASFTARGPTTDFRIKPDLVTVGEKISSALSSGGSHQCSSSDTPANSLLKHEGTSMAAPNAAGAAILTRQFFAEGYYPSGKPNNQDAFHPSASLIKATMIHSTKLMDGFIHLLSRRVWWPLHFKKGHRFSLTTQAMQGFGLINLATVFGPKGDLYVPSIHDRKLKEGKKHTLCYEVGDGKKFKATLVWTDYPSSPASNVHLVNDLDLIVSSKKDGVMYGNGPWSNVRANNEGVPDSRNNVEQIARIPSKNKDYYKVTVYARRIPHGPQDYSLVLSGGRNVDMSHCPRKTGLKPKNHHVRQHIESRIHHFEQQYKRAQAAIQQNCDDEDERKTTKCLLSRGVERQLKRIINDLKSDLN